MTPFRWYLSYLKRYRGLMIFGMAMVFVTSVMFQINPVISGRIVDDVIRGGNYGGLPLLLAILGSVTVLRSLFRFFFLMLFERASQGLICKMREALYRKLMKEDFAFYNQNRTGDLMSRQTGDMDAVRHFTAHVIYFTFENVLVFVFALIMIFTVSAKLALCMCVVLPFTFWVTLSQRKRIKPAFERIRQRFSSLNAFAQENIGGNRVVKAFAKEDFETEKFDVENDSYRDAQVSASYIWMKYIPMFEVLSNALTVILMIMGGFMVIDEQISMGQWVTVNGYLWMLNSPLRQAGWIINDIQRFFTSIEKIHATYVTEPDVKTPEQGINPGRLKGSVEFKNVDYIAPDAAADVILRDMSFVVSPGQTVGLIGATGSGKSTLINLICRFYDATKGEVLVDDIDVKAMDLYGLRGNIGMAMQDVFLFSDTIEGNIAYGDPDAPFSEVERVAKIANAHDFIVNMSEGYDTIVGERGMGLSGGQKQRISLARALLKNPPILILDDTTSAIDMETESLIQAELKQASDERTVFIIAHRISSIMHADQILVLDNGRIVERGTHETLLQENGYYATVFYHQYGEFDQFRKIHHERKGVI